LQAIYIQQSQKWKSKAFLIKLVNKNMINTLENARHCINLMRDRGDYNGQKIGIVERRFSSLVSDYSPGEIVLFRQCLDTGRLVVEKPCEIEDLKSAGKDSPLTRNLLQGVPMDYIRKIRI